MDAARRGGRKGAVPMKKETREEWAEVFREGWPIFLANFIGGMLIGIIATLARTLLR